MRLLLMLFLSILGLQAMDPEQTLHRSSSFPSFKTLSCFNSCELVKVLHEGPDENFLEFLSNFHRAQGKNKIQFLKESIFDPDEKGEMHSCLPDMIPGYIYISTDSFSILGREFLLKTLDELGIRKSNRINYVDGLLKKYPHTAWLENEHGKGAVPARINEKTNYFEYFYRIIIVNNEILNRFFVK